MNSIIKVIDVDENKLLDKKGYEKKNDDLLFFHIFIESEFLE